MEMNRFEELVLKGMVDQKFKRSRISRSERRELARLSGINSNEVIEGAQLIGGSKTGHLKKKHLNRIRIYIQDVVNETIQEKL